MIVNNRNQVYGLRQCLTVSAHLPLRNASSWYTHKMVYLKKYRKSLCIPLHFYTIEKIHMTVLLNVT